MLIILSANDSPPLVAQCDSSTRTGKLESDAMPDGSIKRYQYDFTGRLTQETLANGNYWTTSYSDAARTVTRTFSANGMNEVQVFDGRGDVVSKQDVNGNIFTTSYDGLKRAKIATGPPSGGNGQQTSAQQTMVHTYDASGQVHTVTNGAGERTTSLMDAQGRPTLVSVQNADGSVASNTGFWYLLFSKLTS